MNQNWHCPICDHIIAATSNVDLTHDGPLFHGLEYPRIRDGEIVTDACNQCGHYPKPMELVARVPK